MSKTHFMVYIWLREKNGTFPIGSAYYVGKTVRRYRVVGERHSVHPPRDRANILMLDCESEADALKLEMLLIRIYGRIDKGTGCLRNRTDGGEGTTGLSEETRAKLSAALMGNTRMLGYRFSEESRRKIGTASKNRSPETQAKMNEAHKGLKRSEETRAKMSLSAKARCARENEKANAA